MAELRETIAELEAILGDDGRLRARHLDRARRDPRAVRDEPRRTAIVHDPGELGHRGPHRGRGARRHAHSRRLREGRRRRTPSAPRPAAGAASRAPRLKEEDLVDQVVHTTALAHLLLVLQPRQGLPPAGARGPGEGAQRPGHADRQPALRSSRTSGSRRSSRRGRSTRTGTCSSRPSRGQVKKTAFSEYDKSRREGFIAINLQRRRRARPGASRRAGDDDVFMVSQAAA